MRRFAPCLLVLAVALGAAGCDPISWTRVTLNQPLKATDVAFIVPGTTTLDEVVAPDELLGTRDGLATNYLYEDAKYFRVNLGWPLNFVTPVSYAPHDLVFANSTAGFDTFQVAVDSRGVVRYAAFFRGAAAARYRAPPFEGSKP
jgi:hypothetical protein